MIFSDTELLQMYKGVMLESPSVNFGSGLSLLFADEMERVQKQIE